MMRSRGVGGEWTLLPMRPPREGKRSGSHVDDDVDDETISARGTKPNENSVCVCV